MKTTMPPGLCETTDLSNPGEPHTLATLPGALVVLADGSTVKPGETPIGRAAVREALALLRDSFVRDALYNKGDEYAPGLGAATAALDRLAERFKP
jgi:hypothetical protein